MLISVLIFPIFPLFRLSFAFLLTLFMISLSLRMSLQRKFLPFLCRSESVQFECAGCPSWQWTPGGLGGPWGVFSTGMQLERVRWAFPVTLLVRFVSKDATPGISEARLLQMKYLLLIFYTSLPISPLIYFVWGVPILLIFHLPIHIK